MRMFILERLGNSGFGGSWCLRQIIHEVVKFVINRLDDVDAVAHIGLQDVLVNMHSVINFPPLIADPRVKVVLIRKERQKLVQFHVFVDFEYQSLVVLPKLIQTENGEIAEHYIS